MWRNMPGVLSYCGMGGSCATRSILTRRYKPYIRKEKVNRLARLNRTNEIVRTTRHNRPKSNGMHFVSFHYSWLLRVRRWLQALLAMLCLALSQWSATAQPLSYRSYHLEQRATVIRQPADFRA